MLLSKYLGNSRGFSLIEILIVVVIAAGVFIFAVPMYVSYNADNTVRLAGQRVKEDLNSVISRAVNGVNVGPSPASSTGATRNSWVFAVSKAPSSNYTIGSCGPGMTYTQCSGSANMAVWNITPKTLPSGVTIYHTDSTNSELVLYFTPIYGELRVFEVEDTIPASSVTVSSITVRVDGGSGRTIDFAISQTGEITESTTNL